MEKVASLSQLRADRGLAIEIGGEKILLVRDGEAVRALSAVCPHAGAPLQDGAVCDGYLICPWHKAAFRIADGALAEPPALDGLTLYPVRVESDDIWVDPAPTPPRPAPRKADARVFALVGAGAAGATAAAALREFGFGGRILLIGKEPGLPFDRTSLSKFVVAGQMKPQETPPLRPEGFYAENGIERIESEVVDLDVAGRVLALGDGRRLAFAATLIAPGGEPKRPDLPGADLPGARLLRTREDAAAILADVRPGGRAIILGDGFIGLELAACLRAQNLDVTVVAPQETPFARQFGERIGHAIRTLHEANGVTFLRAEAAALEGDGKVSALILKDGRSLGCDLLVLGVGVHPAAGFVRGATVQPDGGLQVDANLRLADGVYAAGDVAAWPLGPSGEPTRVEHWRVAQQHARIAAANMLGGRETFVGPPFFWTYHYGKNIEYLGHADAWDEEIVVGDVEGLDFVALLMQGDRVAAVVACERQRLTAMLAQRLRAPLMRDEALRWLASGD